MKYLFGTVLLLLSTIVTAQPISLQQILDSIGSRNPGLQQYALKTKASDEMGKAMKAWEAPTAGLGISEFPYGNSSAADGGIMPRKMLMLRMQQMFPNFSKQKREQAYYQSFSHQNQDNLETMKNMLFAKAKMAYYDALIAEKKLTVLDEQEKQLQLLIQVAEGRLAYNKTSLANIYKARAKLSDLQSMRIRLASTVDASKAILNSIMNMPEDTPIQIDTLLNYPLNAANIADIDTAYININRSDIKLTSDKIYTAQLEQQAAASMKQPMLGISVDNMRMNSGMYMYSIMGMVSIPIAPWFSKGYKAQVRALHYDIASMQKMKQAQTLDAIGSIHKDWLKYHAAEQDMLIFKKDIVPAYAKTYQANMNAFSENTGDIFETLMAWDDLTMKNMEYYDKVGDWLNIRVLLDAELQQY